MRYFLIADNMDTQTGFRLAGIEGVVVHKAQEVEEALSTAMNTPDIGVILLSEGLYMSCLSVPPMRICTFKAVGFLQKTAYFLHTL